MPALKSAVLVPLIASLLIACSAATEAVAPTNATAALPSVKTDNPASRAPAANAELIAAIGAKCADASTARDCVAGNVDEGDFYDIEIASPCDKTGFFAGVASNRAALLDVLPVTGSSAKANAELARGQFLCVQAIARSGQNPAYFYVAAIPTSSIPTCRGNATCAKYGERPVTRMANSPTSVACTVDRQGVPRGACPSGWIDQSAVEAFSNGL